LCIEFKQRVQYNAITLQNVFIRSTVAATIAVVWMVRIAIAIHSNLYGMIVGRSFRKPQVKTLVGAIAIGSRIGRPLELLHDFLQDRSIRFQFEALAWIPGGVLVLRVSVAYFAHDKKAYSSQDKKGSDAEKDRDGNVEAASLFALGNGSRRGIKVKTRPISRNIALDKLTVLQKTIFFDKKTSQTNKK